MFNPYSGVKTSVLFLDKTAAKGADEILFVRVSADGFDLGAQRRPVAENDLPQVRKILSAWKRGEKLDGSEMALWAAKGKIAEDDEYNLSAERYRAAVDYSNAKWPMVAVNEVLESVKNTKKIPKSKFLSYGKYPIIDQSENFIAGYWDDDNDVFALRKPVVIFGDHSRNFKFVDFDFVIGADGTKILQCDDRLVPRLFYYMLRDLNLESLGYSRHFKELREKKIPLPPLAVQEEIVAELDGYQRVIDGARLAIANWKPTININPSWPKVKLGEIVSEMKTGFACGKSNKESEGIIHLRPMNLTTSGEFVLGNSKYISEEEAENRAEYFIKEGDVLFNNTNSKELVGKTCVVNKKIKALYSNHITRIRVDDKKYKSKFLAFMLYRLRSDGIFLRLCNKWVGQAGINLTALSEIKIPLPPLSEQQRIVAEIAAEEQAIAACRRLIDTHQKKIHTTIATLREKEG